MGAFSLALLPDVLRLYRSWRSPRRSASVVVGDVGSVGVVTGGGPEGTVMADRAPTGMGGNPEGRETAEDPPTRRFDGA